MVFPIPIAHAQREIPRSILASFIYFRIHLPDAIKRYEHHHPFTALYNTDSWWEGKRFKKNSEPWRNMRLIYLIRWKRIPFKRMRLLVTLHGTSKSWWSVQLRRNSCNVYEVVHRYQFHYLKELLMWYYSRVSSYHLSDIYGKRMLSLIVRHTMKKKYSPPMLEIL